MSAVGFRSGQKFRFPKPYDHIECWFEDIRYENGIPIIGYRDAYDEYAEMRGYDLVELTHA